MHNIDDFREQNPKDWKQLIDQLFPQGVPARFVWDQPQDIIRVLERIGSIFSGDYTFLPGTGGLTLTGAKTGNEEGFIELQFEGSARVGNIKQLHFESFGDPHDYQWSYFRLETAPLAPTGVGYVTSHRLEERITELRPGQYASLDTWEYRADRRENNKEPLPSTARSVTRLLGGSLVIFPKTSIYNQSRGTDGAVHNLMTADQFRSFIDRSRHLDFSAQVMRILNAHRESI